MFSFSFPLIKMGWLVEQKKKKKNRIEEGSLGHIISDSKGHSQLWDPTDLDTSFQT